MKTRSISQTFQTLFNLNFEDNIKDTIPRYTNWSSRTFIPALHASHDKNNIIDRISWQSPLLAGFNCVNNVKTIARIRVIISVRAINIYRNRHCRVYVFFYFSIALTGSNMSPREIGVSMKYKEIYNSVRTVYDTEIYDRFVLLAFKNFYQTIWFDFTIRICFQGFK